MRKLSKEISTLCNLHNDEWLINQRVAGKCVSEILLYLKKLIENKTKLTTKEISLEVEKIIIDKKCEPTFKGYRGFPDAICISINKQLVHGIPSDYTFNEGDVVSFDLGATYNGAIADAAITCIYGESLLSIYSRMIETANNSLDRAISTIKVGKKIGCVGEAIYKSANNNGFKVIESYGGHSLYYGVLHAAPFIANKDISDNGFRIQRGLTLCIEPMLVPYSDNSTKVGEDGWAVYTNDIGVHVEKTVFVHEDQVEIITNF